MLTKTECVRIENFIAWYRQNEKRFEKAAEYVHNRIMTCIEEQKLDVANSYFRAKSEDSVYQKAKAIVERNGVYALKYFDPQNEITVFPVLGLLFICRLI